MKFEYDCNIKFSNLTIRTVRDYFDMCKLKNEKIEEIDDYIEIIDNMYMRYIDICKIMSTEYYFKIRPIYEKIINYYNKSKNTNKELDAIYIDLLKVKSNMDVLYDNNLHYNY